MVEQKVGQTIQADVSAITPADLQRGLGAARDPHLIQRIGAATAAEVAATGIKWTFAPTLAVPQDPRWGRSYEGFAERPEPVAVTPGG